MRPINARKIMIAALGAAAVVAGSIVPAHAATEPTDTGAAQPDVVAAAEQPEPGEGAEGDHAADAENPEGDGEDADGPIASWKQDSIGWWFDFGDGTYAQNEQVEIDGLIYRFDSRGYMVTGWYNQEGMWEYYAQSGVQAFGWHLINGSWYYLDMDLGLMQIGWLKLDGSWYYLSASGAMLTGWVKVGDSWYYLSASGAMVTGTQWIDGERHWFYESGVWWGVY